MHAVVVANDVAAVGATLGLADAKLPSGFSTAAPPSTNEIASSPAASSVTTVLMPAISISAAGSSRCGCPTISTRDPVARTCATSSVRSVRYLSTSAWPAGKPPAESAMHGVCELPMNVITATVVVPVARSLPSQSHGAVPPKNWSTTGVLPSSSERYGAVSCARESPISTTDAGAALVAGDAAGDCDGMSQAATRRLRHAASAGAMSARRCNE